MFVGLLAPDPAPDLSPALDPDPSIIKQKYCSKKNLDFTVL